MDWTQKYTYNFPCPIRFGPGVIKEVGPHLKEQGLLNPLVVTDPGFASLPLFAKIMDELKSAGLKPVQFTQIDKNPVKKNVLDGANSYHEQKADSIIGLGGGASMDVARAIALKAYHERDLFDFDDALGGDKYVVEEIPYFITIPTTSGTGSEVGRSTVISEDESHQKRVLFSPRLMAKMVFADPELTMELPPHITAATGIDALTHNIEAYVSKGFSPMCDGIAIEAIKLINESLYKASTAPCLKSRSKMQMAALMGATSFQKGLGVVHSTAHPLSTLFDTHHGLANAIMLPYGIKFNAECSSDRFEFLCKVLDLGEVSSKALIDWTLQLNNSLGLPRDLSAIDVGTDKIDALSDLALKDVCHQCNPRPVSLENFKEIYSWAIEGNL
ncbi:MAG: alcohol dehydrogenase [Halobacteriovorax sp.]|nr:alcohol dehydrogenase [Halobacteriovorax sp.]|tara:strand:- start:73233 stop:74393 length:1161 start_codon:yes stop_codon:yes gene_type:complete